jgi:ribosomal protein RSM22 (predicted rRNA methylase)
MWQNRILRQWKPPSPEAALSQSMTWNQQGSKARHKRRMKIRSLAAQLTYEYNFLRFMCQKRPHLRQWIIRDDFCQMNPGTVEMSPSMQHAFMRIFNSRPRHEIRNALLDLVPILQYRNKSKNHALISRDDPKSLIPQDQPDSLNAKKREMWERKDDAASPFLNTTRFSDPKQQSQFRWSVRRRLIKFQRQLAVANAAASRTVLYGESDAIAYFLYRGPAIYAGVHRCLFELSKQLPWFVPKTMMDFGAGTGCAIQAAKEIYDPSSMAHPVSRKARRYMNFNDGAAQWALDGIKHDLEALQKTNSARKTARFMAVAALIDKGDVNMEDIPQDLRAQIAKVAQVASEAAGLRQQDKKVATLRHVVNGAEWSDDLAEALDAEEASLDAVADFNSETVTDADGTDVPKKTWWEKFVEDERGQVEDAVKRRLKPLQRITAIEPSPGMMEVAMTVLQEEAPNVSWRRFLTPEDVENHDLVIAAYTLSEIASPAERRTTVQQLWKHTKGVLVLVEHANAPNFDILMEARDTILEFKDVGLWDWQPTIVGPCPHEHRCPIRFSSIGVKRPKMRVCKTDVTYSSTFIDKWVQKGHVMRLEREGISYLIVARNELVPERAQRRAAVLKEAEDAEKTKRDTKQRELAEASTKTNTVFERLSDEVLATPIASQLSSVVDGHHSATARDSESLQLPRIFPLATHRYNSRPFVDAAFEHQRPISPTEFLVVRSEAADMRKKVREHAARYHRVVFDPDCKGRVQATLCTNDGSLMRCKIYRRYFGKSRKFPFKKVDMWQFVGGWHLAKRARPGWLFPNDVPLFGVRKLDQIEQPNTMMGRMKSPVETTAMSHGASDETSKTTDEKLAAEEAAALGRSEREEASASPVFGRIRELADAFTSKSKTPAHFDSRTKVTSQQWANAVRAAKRRAHGPRKP